MAFAKCSVTAMVFLAWSLQLQVHADVERLESHDRARVARSMDGERALKLIGRYVNEFFDVHLKGAKPNLLSQPDTPAVSIEPS